MSVTPADKLAGLLPVVISGGRPKLAQRPTARLLPALDGLTAPPVWLVREDEASSYERDGHEVASYPRAFAEAYAQGHWTGAAPYQPGGFLGAFCGREAACLLAEARHCWGVMQLDDNLTHLACYMLNPASCRVVTQAGGLGLFADLLAAVTLATNGAMVGAALTAAHPAGSLLAGDKPIFARPGFPYSCFIEVVSPAREPWYGPTEDDILHAYQYGANASAATALVVVPLRYRKDHRAKDGMRQAYDHTRSVGLQRVAPQMAQLAIMRRANNSGAKPRVSQDGQECHQDTLGDH